MLTLLNIAVEPDGGPLVVAVDLALGLRQHPARPASAVQDGTDSAGFAEQFLVAREQQVDHEPHDLPRREVLAGGLIGGLREAPDQLSKIARISAFETLSGCRSTAQTRAMTL